MNIAFVITRSDAVGGATIHVRDLALTLTRDGHRATVLVGGKGGEVTDRLRNAGVAFRIVPQLDKAIHPVKDIAAVRAVRTALAELQPDLVSTHTAKAGLVGRLAAASLGLPALYTPHGWAITDRVSRLGGHLFSVAERLAAPLATRIVNVCEAERQLALRHNIAAANRMEVVHNGVVDVQPDQRARFSASVPRITMVARFEAPKDHQTLMRAMAMLTSQPWQLSLVGSGPLESDTRELAGHLGLSQRVEFLGSHQPVADVLAASDVFVLSSRSEGFPRSILEAMRAGLPVVASDAGGSAEAIVHGRSGFVVRKSCAAQLASALQSLIASRDLRQRFGQAGRHRYEQHFTFDHMYQKTLAIYRNILQSPQGALRPSTATIFRRTA